MIKFLDLYKINSRFDQEFQEKFKEFMDSGHYILGHQVTTFETNFADYCGSKYCIGISNGLDALKLIFEAYKVLGILEPEDEIIAPANTYIATILAINGAGLKPILVEPDEHTFNISPAKAEKAITKRTKAILGVHLYGQLYNVMELERLAKSYNLLLLEDAAQAHGAIFYDNRKAGNLSNAAAFSFYPTKNLGALGDAGAITTNDSQLANVICKLRNYGRETAYINNLKGFNFRLDELQATFLNVKLKYLDSDNEKRRTIANKYISGIKNPKIRLPFYDKSKNHCFHLFVVRNEQRDKLKNYLHENGIETFIHYPVPVHKQKAYDEFSSYELPITEMIHNEVLSLPLNPALTEEETELIVNVLCKFR